MLQSLSKLRGYAVEAKDGNIGKVDDFLFDDATWKLRWLVVDASSWLTERKILVHPSAIIQPSAIGRPDYEKDLLPVALTKAQIMASPDSSSDRPVSYQMEADLFDYYGWDPLWGGASYFGGGGMAYPLLSPSYFGRAAALEVGEVKAHKGDGDPHLRSVAAVTGYHILSEDGEIGHVEGFIADDTDWGIRYLIVDTKNWWPGKHVLISPYAVQTIDWSEQQIQLDIDRDHVRSAPPWNPLDDLDQAYERGLHAHYGWAGYSW